MLYLIIGIFSLFKLILGYENHKHSSAFVALDPPALWSHPFNKDETPPLTYLDNPLQYQGLLPLQGRI